MFFPPELTAKVNVNVARYPWAAAMRRQVMEAAGPWMRMSDDALWDLMFGSTISRSWMVWSDGYCPACMKSVPMYTWEMDALQRPWKVRCPHCKELFPKNDFDAFYRSGLDAHGAFDPKRADRSLLFNTAHPDPNDPLHRFAVDDGEGYVEDGKRWRFIGAYLIYGQWKQAVHGGITRLAAAYAVTGDRGYAHRAGVLLDRVADLYPSFDFKEQGIVYERKGDAGYVSTWHDAAEETREMALAYDRVRPALREDAALIAFLHGKAREHGLANPKATWADVQRNIEDGLLRDPLKNRARIHTNYPRQEIAIATLRAVLAWPANRNDVYAVLDPMFERATAVDGVTGEKGLSAYSAYTIQGLAQMMAQFSRLEPNFLKEMLARHPRLRETWRFHLDTWCMMSYYPQVGDSGTFAMPDRQYAGVGFSKSPGPDPSMFTFLKQLYDLTGDAGYIQALYRANGDTEDRLPYDLTADDPAAFQREVRKVIAREGPALKTGSVNKKDWRLAILRSGSGDDARALWMSYDAGGGHGHANGLNLGLFALGLDLLPERGYPPVQYGGWESPRARWYTMTAAHNTVVVNGEQQSRAAGITTLWVDGRAFRAMRASGAALYGIRQYERTAATVDLPGGGFYVLDIFRVVGGSDHAKFTHGYFGSVTSERLDLRPTEDYGHGTQMRGFRSDRSPAPGWSVTWRTEDRYKLLPPGAPVHLRGTDLTTGAEASLCESWVSYGGYDANAEAWIPSVMTRRRASAGPLSSTFVAVLEPYRKARGISRIRRLPLETADGRPAPDACAAVEVTLADGRRDLLISRDVEDPLRQTPAGPLAVKDWGCHTDIELCLIRQDASGAVRRIAACRGRTLSVGDVSLALRPGAEYVEIALEADHAVLVAGRAQDVQSLTIGGRSRPVRVE